MKKVIALVVVVLLVVAFAITSVYADSTYPPSYQVGRGQCTFTDDGFVLTPTDGRFANVTFRGQNSSSGVVEFTLGQAAPSQFNIATLGNSSQQDIVITNLSDGLSVNAEGGSYIYCAQGVTSGSFEFYITPKSAYPNTSQNLLFSTPDNAANITASFTFLAFDWNGETLIDNTGTIDRFVFELPYGNALRISSNSAFTINRRAYSISNSTYNYQKYVRASDDFTYRVNGAYQGVVSNSALSGTFGVGVYNSNDVLSLLIPWQPVNQNILGRATDYNFYSASPDPSAEISFSSSQSYLIWYPYYANNQDTSKLNEVPMTVAIDIFHTEPIVFTTYPITGNTSSSGEDTYISNTAATIDSGSSSQSSGSDGDIVVTFDNAPTAGGNHGQAPINDNNSILGVLSNLQNTLLGLFNKAIDGIHNLISLGSSFLQSVQVMFSWLPGVLVDIIFSGFVILLTIGVLKTLWR